MIAEHSPPPLPPPPVEETVDDLERILALPRRPPVNCVKDPDTRRYAPETEALVAAVTARFSRPRLSCACRPRLVQRLSDGSLLVFRVLPEELPPEPPLHTSVEAFAADQVASIPGVCHPTARDVAAAEAARALRPGEEVRLDAADREDSPDGHACIVELSAVQAWALDECPRATGGLGHMGVGSGKSGIAILAPLAFTAAGLTEADLAVLLFESNQRAHYKSQYRRFREHFRVPSITFDDGTSYPVSCTPPLHLVTYARLGHPKWPDVLDGYDATLLLGDEGHRLTGENNTATRRRYRRYITKKIVEREQRVAQGLPVKSRAVFSLVMSGTLEDKGVRDTQPLAAHGLGTLSPLPLDDAEAKRWALCMDPCKRPDRTSSTARRLQYAFAGRIYDASDVASLLAGGPEVAIREGFRRRRVETLGVITAHSPDCDAAIYFRERKPPALPPAVRAALAGVRDKGERPDGDLIVEQSMRIQIAKEVGSGFYYYWRFPGIPCDYAKDHPGESCPANAPRCAGCAKIDDWFQKRKAYGRELGPCLLRALPHLDSPKLAANAAARAWADVDRPKDCEVYCVDCNAQRVRGAKVASVVWDVSGCPAGHKTHLPGWQALHWPAWADVKDTVPHEQRVWWIDEFLARDAAEWAKKNRGVVWYSSVALGEKIAQLAGLPRFGGGKDAEAAIRAETGKRSIVASIDAWGRGLDGLQYKFHRQLWAEMMSSNKIAEQLLGRLHRRGQPADAIYTDYYKHIPEIARALRQLRALAEFNWQMTGNEQKVRIADFGEGGDDGDEEIDE